MGPRPTRHSIERINTDGNYEPSNCRWASQAEQARNTSYNRYFERGGLRLTMADWADRLGLSRSTVNVRLHRGKTEAQALGLEP